MKDGFKKGLKGHGKGCAARRGLGPGETKTRTRAGQAPTWRGLLLLLRGSAAATTGGRFRRTEDPADREGVTLPPEDAGG